MNDSKFVPTPSIIKDLKEIFLYYECFILDIWGILHDGSNIYNGVKNSLEFLKKNDKKVFLLSNAPRRSSVVQKTLEKLGIGQKYYIDIISSGEVAYQLLTDKKLVLNEHESTYGKKYIFMGREYDRQLLQNEDFEEVNDFSEASFILNMGFSNPTSTIKDIKNLLAKYKEYDLPMLCINPDKIVTRQNGKIELCAGTMAAEYEKIGGMVEYIGKPFDTIYEYLCEKHSLKDTSDIIAIGDSMETDICGANNFYLASALVTGGIHNTDVRLDENNIPILEDVSKLVKKYKYSPLYVTSKFGIDIT